MGRKEVPFVDHSSFDPSHIYAMAIYTADLIYNVLAFSASFSA
jgi:hypothetical protein